MSIFSDFYKEIVDIMASEVGTVKRVNMGVDTYNTLYNLIGSHGRLNVKKASEDRVELIYEAFSGPGLEPVPSVLVLPIHEYTLTRLEEYYYLKAFKRVKRLFKMFLSEAAVSLTCSPEDVIAKEWLDILVKDYGLAYAAYKMLDLPQLVKRCKALPEIDTTTVYVDTGTYRVKYTEALEKDLQDHDVFYERNVEGTIDLRQGDTLEYIAILQKHMTEPFDLNYLLEGHWFTIHVTKDSSRITAITMFEDVFDD